MKLRCLFTTLAITILFAGCGINENSNRDEASTASSTASSIETSEEAPDTASEEVPNATSEKVSVYKKYFNEAGINT